MLDRMRDGSARLLRGQLMAAGAVVVFVLGIIEYDTYYNAGGHSATWWEIAYQSFRLFTLDFTPSPVRVSVPLLLNILRFVAPVLTVTSLLNAVGRASRDQTDRWFARRWRDHVVVCGSSPLARLVVRELRHDRQRVVAVDEQFAASVIDECRAHGARVVAAGGRSIALADSVRGAARAIVAIDGDAETLRWATFIAAVNDGPAQVDALVKHPDLVELAPDVGLGHVVVRSAGEWTANGAMVVMPPIRPPSGPLRIAVVSDLQDAAELANAIWSGHVGLGEAAEIHLVGPLHASRLNLALPLRNGVMHMHRCDLDDAAATLAAIEGGRSSSATVLSDPIYVWTSDASESISVARSLRDHLPARRVVVLSAEDDVIAAAADPVGAPGVAATTHWLEFVGITDLAANGLLLERFGEGRLAACLFADHVRHGTHPDTDGPHAFGLAPETGWRELGPAQRHRYMSAAAAINQTLRQRGLTVDYDSRLTGGDRVDRTSDLTPVELAAVAAEIARRVDTVLPTICTTADDVLRRQPFVDLAARLPSLVALSGGSLQRTVAAVNLDAADIDSIARSLHEAYVMHRRLDGETADTNPSLRPWDELPERMRESNNEQARDIASKIAMLDGDLVVGDGSIGWPTNGPLLEALAEVEHRRWCRALRERGFTYGPTRDEVRRTHPNLVPYAELVNQPGSQVKDLGAMRDIPLLLDRTAYRIHIAA